MKVNSKTTNAATLVCHQGGQRTVNGIIGNTRRGIQVDQTLDPDSNNPVANKPVSTALAALVGKVDAALQKPTGLTKTKLVGVGASGQENIEIGDNLTLANGKLSAAGGSSGKSVSPTLNLIDMETEGVRTSITEEEKMNFDNGLYNQVIYFVNSTLDLANPGKLFYFGDQYLFSQFGFTGNDDIGYSVVSLETYQITIETKNASGEYPITINKIMESPLSSGSGNVVTIEVASMPDTQTTIDVSKITNDTQFVNIKETSTNKNYLLYRVGSDFASCFSNELTQGKIVAYYYIDTQQEQLYYFISSVGKLGKIFGNHDIQVPAVSSNNILPCTTADNGKVLSVVNGEAQWATPAGSGGITVTFED